MKKKGLIISTVVMVVVLIASLTTATYAWFTTAGVATVTPIDFSVTSAADLVIGVKGNNTIGAAPAWSDFYSDATKFTANEGRGEWTGDTNGLGLSVDTTLQLSNIQKAVYSFTNISKDATSSKINSATIDEYDRGSSGNIVTANKGFNVAHTALKASGTGSKVDASTYEEAIRNTDYLDVVFGVAPATNEIKSYGCLVTVKNNSTLNSLGMNAAIHVAYSMDGTNFTEVDVYGMNRAGDQKSKATKPVNPTENIAGKTVSYESKVQNLADGDATVWIPLNAVTSADAVLPTGIDGLKQLHLVIYICGPDSDCVTGAAGSATITIEFLSINNGTYNK